MTRNCTPAYLRPVPRFTLWSDHTVEVQYFARRTEDGGLLVGGYAPDGIPIIFRMPPAVPASRPFRVRLRVGVGYLVGDSHLITTPCEPEAMLALRPTHSVRLSIWVNEAHFAEVERTYVVSLFTQVPTRDFSPVEKWHRRSASGPSLKHARRPEWVAQRFAYHCGQVTYGLSHLWDRQSTLLVEANGPIASLPASAP